MPSKAYFENLATIEAIPSDVVPVTGYTDATPAIIDRTTDGGTENAIGCATAKVFADISAGPAAATALDVYAEWSFDGTTYSIKEYCFTIPVAISQTGLTVSRTLELVAPYSKLYLQAPSATLTCTLYAVPEQWEGQ